MGTETHSQTLCRESLNERPPSKTSPKSSENPTEEKEEILEESKEIEKNRSTRLSEPTKKGVYELRDWGSKPQLLCIYIIAISLVFYGTPDCKNKWSLTLMFALRTLSPVDLSCTTSIWKFLLRLILFSSVWLLSHRSLFIHNERHKGCRSRQ